ncbi:MAG: hypothetical protein Q9204_005235 [Flavoplaca sp. TL-2023a]
MACQLQHILNPLDEQDMSAVKILHDMTSATHTTTAPSDTTMALTPAVDGHDNSQPTEVDLDVHDAANILMRLSNTPQARLQPIYVIPGTDSEWEPHPEESEKRVNAWISDGSLIPIIASRRSAIFKLAKGRIVEGERVCESESESDESESESESESEEEVDDDATIDNEEAVKAREEELEVHRRSLALALSSPSSSPSPPPTAIPTIIITPPTPTSLALSATSKRKAKRTNIDTSTARPSTSRAPNNKGKGKEPITPPAITPAAAPPKRKSRVEEHAYDIHTPSAGPSTSRLPNKKRKVAALLPTPTSISPYSPTGPITPPIQRCQGEDVGAGGKGGRGLDGGYWDLTAVAKRIVEGREKGGEVKVVGARRSGRVTRKSVRFAL